MKRTAVTTVTALCAAVIVAAIVVPFGAQDMPKPQAAVQAPAASQQSGPANSQGAGFMENQPSTEQAAESEAVGRQVYEQGEVLVGLRDGATAEELNGRLAALDYVATKAVGEDDVVFGYVKLNLAEGIAVEEAERRLAAEPLIEAAQPNYTYYATDDGATTAAQGTVASASSLAPALTTQATTVNDPDVGRQWGLEAINAFDAWDTAKAEGAVTVAVLDSGMDRTHEDFDSTRIVGAYSVLNGNQNVADKYGHGTKVAGIIAATTNNAKGVAGVSYNANIMPVQVMDANGKVDTGILAKGLEHVVQQAEAKNIKVANISIGSDGEAGDMHDAVYEKAIAAVHDAGILVVYSAGNGAITAKGAYNCYPADFDFDEGAIGVIAVDQKGVRADFSNFNQAGQVTKELAAPGKNIYTTTMNGGYGEDSGTSYAAPFVSGVAALMFANNSSLTPAQVRNALCNTAAELGAEGWDAQTGYGMVDAKAALTGTKSGSSYEATRKPAADVVSLTSSMVTLSKTTYTYNGKKCSPEVTVKAHGITLRSGIDYSVNYANNTNAGSTAKAIVMGKGNYKETVNKAFTIKPAPLASMKLSATEFTYDGTAKTPTATVRGVKNGVANKPLSRNTDFTLSTPKSRTNAGTYTFTATGKGNYTGTVKASFKIAKAKNTLAAKGAAKTLKAAQLKKAKQTLKLIAVNKARGTVTYKAGSSKYLTVNKKTGKVTVKKGTPKGTWKVKVAVKAAGNKNYKALTKTITVKVKVK